ncbi:GntR family transcriptional regulator [Pseudarthrobacter sulfonivorans]|uniref:GntR family transcriptional regulator n=1 Tax=Pseudarthrobacter sulfonivorans TaxID=121292 RepID=UPI00168A8AC6|nr:GntR family transcriptional regulator [Pseudarthrobacter sulfonivorans]
MPARSTVAANSTDLVARVSLRDQAVDLLRGWIVRGELETGTRLNEVELAAKMGISRGPLREAIQRLSAEGLIDLQGGRGAFIREVSGDDVRQMYELRQVLEVAAVKFAAERISDNDIARIEEMISDMDRRSKEDPPTAHTVDSDFHLNILQLAKNSYLEQTGGELQTQFRIARLRTGVSPGLTREARDEHRAILVAVAAGDVRAAGKAMTLHLRKSLSRFTAMSGDVD